MAKIGEEHLSAMGRQGLRELRAAMYPESNVAQPSEYGIYGTKTPGEVAEDRRGDDGEELADKGGAASAIDERLGRSKDATNRDEGERGFDREE